MRDLCYRKAAPVGENLKRCSARRWRIPLRRPQNQFYNLCSWRCRKSKCLFTATASFRVWRMIFSPIICLYRPSIAYCNGLTHCTENKTTFWSRSQSGNRPYFNPREQPIKAALSLPVTPRVDDWCLYSAARPSWRSSELILTRWII